MDTEHIEPEWFNAIVYWGSAERGMEIIKWAVKTCPSYIRLYHKSIDFNKPMSLENSNMELWFSNEYEATLCALRWA